MDFEFENKKDPEFEEDFVENTTDETPDNFDNFEDINSNSDGYDIMSDADDNKRKHNKPRIIINVATSVVLAISILITGVMGMFIGYADEGVMNIPLFKWLFSDNDAGVGDSSKEVGDFPELKLSDSEDVTYFLVVGCDWTATKQTDVIVVVCMDHKNNKVTMLQIPRDTYVGDYSGDGKINGAYVSAKQGELKINALRRCISNQLGIPIDHYVLFSIEGAVNVVDAIGGVKMNIPNPIEIENPLHFGKYYKIGPGKITLSGKDAIGFMRKRSGTVEEDENYASGSDLGRVKQQRKFYAALFKELQNMSTIEIWKAANSCFDQVQTDLSLNETVAFALAAKKLDSKKIKIFALPGQGSWYNGLSYYSFYKDEYIKSYNKYMNPTGKKLTANDVNMLELYTINGDIKYGNWFGDDNTTLNDY